jgi:hypothetical protein
VCYLPPGATPQNTFFSVDVGGKPIKKIKGAHSITLSDATGSTNSLTNNNPLPGSVATIKPGTSVNLPTALANNYSYYYDQRILFVDQNDTNDPKGLRSVQDICPDCSDSTKAGGKPNHMDVYNSSPVCGRNSLPDYGNGATFTTINLR